LKYIAISNKYKYFYRSPFWSLWITLLWSSYTFHLLFFFIWILMGGVHTGSTRHCGHCWPNVPALGDCENGEVGGMNGFGRGNWSTQEKTCRDATLSTKNPTCQTGPSVLTLSPKQVASAT
jgi:hypothetical protein